jgi:choice-of-anchor C domain-containing protein
MIRGNNVRKLLLAAVAAIAFPGGAQAAMFTNGSFEAGEAPGGYTTLYTSSTAITGWTVSSGSIDYIGSLWAASDGSRSLDLSGGDVGSIAQAFDTVIGRAYKVTYDLAGNPQGGVAEKRLSVFASGAGNVASTESFDTTGRTEAAMGWSRRSYSFVADSATTTLSFSSLTAGAYGPALDNVAVTALSAVPEPATWGMMIAGFGLAGGVLRRGRRAPALVRA